MEFPVNIGTLRGPGEGGWGGGGWPDMKSAG